MSTGSNIKRERIKKGISRIQLANHLGVSPSTISRYENNQREPKNETLKAIAKFLDIPLLKLMLNIEGTNIKKLQGNCDIESVLNEEDIQFTNKISLLNSLYAELLGTPFNVPNYDLYILNNGLLNLKNIFTNDNLELILESLTILNLIKKLSKATDSYSIDEIETLINSKLTDSKFVKLKGTFKLISNNSLNTTEKTSTKDND